MLQALQTQLETAVAAPLCISPDAQVEARSNEFLLYLNAESIRCTTVEDLQDWLRQVVAAKRQQLHQHRQRPDAMRFYCWVDAMAGQLRYSLVTSTENHALPFGCAVRLVSQLNVIQEYLQLDTPGTLSWKDLETAEPMLAVTSYALDVWDARIA